MTSVDMKEILDIARQAGLLVMSIYNQAAYEVKNKTDQTPLTQADIESHTYINGSLQRLYPSIPIISEESTQQYVYDERKSWEYFFLVDPLDGTKEFIQRNGEFTINIALIKNNRPILGVVHAPALDITYYAQAGKGAYKVAKQQHIKLPIQQDVHPQKRVVVSRSHCCDQTENFIKSLQTEVIRTPSGSALKFGLIAEGHADIYPRFSPTMEWDTAAGQILVNETGKEAWLIDKSGPLLYNKAELVNPGFVVQ